MAARVPLVLFDRNGVLFIREREKKTRRNEAKRYFRKILILDLISSGLAAVFFFLFFCQNKRKVPSLCCPSG